MSVDETPAEEPEGPSRAAGGCVLAIAASAAGGVAYAVPELGYFVAGLTITTIVRKAHHAWTTRGQQDDEEVEEVDIVAALHELSDGTQHVRLTQLQEAAGLPDTKAVRALLDEAGIRVRAGVRTEGGNGPGVHATDIPAPSPTPSSPSPGSCLCRSEAANANTNNRPDIVQDAHNPNRWHVVKETV